MSTSENTQPEIVVRDDPDQHRCTVAVDGVVAGFAIYHVRGGRHIFVHTEIDPAFEGQGLGSVLARGALDDVEAKNGTVVPLCPFIAGWIDRHPAYQALVDQDVLDRLGPA